MSDPYLIDLVPGDDEITRDIVIQRWLKEIVDSISGPGAGVTSITGTAGQITASSPTGAVTLSLPSALTGIASITSSTSLSLIAGGTDQNITLTPNGTGFISASNGIIATTDNFYIARSGSTSNGYFLEASVNNGVPYVNAFQTFDVRVYNGSAYAKTLVVDGNGGVPAVLLGTTTKTANAGILQLATHTTSAGGIGFGTGTALFTTAAGAVTLQKISAGNAIFQVLSAAASSVTILSDGSNGYVSTTGALVLRSNGTTTALTLDSSQNASFAATIGQTTGNFNGAGNIRAGSTGSIYWNTRSTLASPSDGVITLANLAATDFGRLQFGGTTSAFPALKRSSAGLELRLADDTAGSYLGIAATPSASTCLIVAGSTTSKSSIRIPSGTAPSSPVAGDFFWDGTNLRFYDGSVLRTLTWV